MKTLIVMRDLSYLLLKDNNFTTIIIKHKFHFTILTKLHIKKTAIQAVSSKNFFTSNLEAS